ncbi:hypothetical protein ACAG96_05390 [Candidatus Izemoplasma sp. B36]|uniref:hypothetical protein n=1 Tax=Candidatus Izemoplasma sp. B36 TaxID=3242468 RepID=UPI0035567BB6
MKKNKTNKSTTKSIIRKLLLFIGIAGIIIVPILVFNPRVSLEGKVSAKYTNSIMIEVTNDSSHNGIYMITITEDTKIYNSYGDRVTINDVFVNDPVEIVYDGNILESNPAQIHVCYKVKIK